MPEVESQAGLRILLDQNVPKDVTMWLRENRPTWEVAHTSDVHLDGSPDSEVFSWAQENGYLIVTFDVHFADQRSFPVGNHHGIIRLRVWPTTVEEVVRALGRLLDEVTDQELRGALVIVGRNNIRIRSSGRPLESG